MKRLNDAKYRYENGLGEFSEGKISKKQLELIMGLYFRGLSDLAFYNFSMPETVQRDLRERLHKLNSRFDDRNEWPNIEENIKILNGIADEMKDYMEKEDRGLEDAMVNLIRSDSDLILDERMQDYFFSYYMRLDSRGLMALQPSLNIPELKKLEEPKYPSESDYLPSIKEVEEIMQKEKEQKQ